MSRFYPPLWPTARKASRPKLKRNIAIATLATTSSYTDIARAFGISNSRARQIDIGTTGRVEALVDRFAKRPHYNQDIVAAEYLVDVLATFTKGE